LEGGNGWQRRRWDEYRENKKLRTGKRRGKHQSTRWPLSVMLSRSTIGEMSNAVPGTSPYV